MNKNFFFFLISTIILLLSIVVLNTGPIINKIKGIGSQNNFDSNWGTLNCLYVSDQYEIEKEKRKIQIDLGGESENNKKERDRNLNQIKKKRDSCYWMQAMHGLEYSAFTIDMIIGFICSILGFLHYLEEGKSFTTKSGLIGLVSGVIAFIITLVYLIYNILVYTKVSPNELKTEENRAYAKWDNSKNAYICLFFEDDNKDSIYAKFSELGKKQYNYNTDFYLRESNSEFKNCIYYSNCENNKEIFKNNQKPYLNDGSKLCTKVYKEYIDNINYSDLNNCWLTTIILSSIIILCNIGLSFFGFLLFRNKEESGAVPVI